MMKASSSHGARSRRQDAQAAIAAGIFVAAAALFPGAANAGAPGKSETAEKPSVAAKPLAELQTSGPLAAQYCVAARDTIAEARFAQQAEQLERLVQQAEERLVAVEKRSAELKEWIAKRDKFSAAATQQLVAIFGAMRPESASEQLVRLDTLTAAAIISRLDVRAASAILNDMPPEKAARLAGVIAGSARKDDQEKQ